MAKKKRKTRKRTTKRKARTSKKKSSDSQTSKGPEYMVQVNESMMVRKDILESLRDVIIFMQGYENFRAIQDQKVALFTTLKEEVKELKSLIDDKLHKLLPQGKIQLTKPEQEQLQPETSGLRPITEVKPKQNQLTKLEMQLQDIESQLNTIR